MDVQPQSSSTTCEHATPYLVRTLPRAERDLEAIFLFISAASSPAAYIWFAHLAEAIESLSEEPQRSPKTREDPTLYHLLYGNKPHVYRIIYNIDTAARIVNILHVLHGARVASNLRLQE